MPLRSALKRLLERRGWEAKRLGDAHFLAEHRVDCVFDVGANRGQFAQGLRRRGYRGRIVSLEPASADHAVLAGLAARDEGWIALHCAAGAAAGQATLNLAVSSVFNSFKPLAQRGADFSNDARAWGRDGRGRAAGRHCNALSGGTALYQDRHAGF